MKVKLITDSTCNCPEKFRQDLDIDVVPLYVVFGDKSYKDYVEMSVEAFHRRLAATSEMPTTSQPTPEDFAHVYEKARAEGYSDAIVVTVGGKISGTFASARTAAERTEGIGVHVVDSNNISLLMGWMLEQARQVLADGGSIDDAIAAIERIKANNINVFAVTDMRHVAHSGRIQGYERAAQSTVKIRPIIRMTDGVPKVIDQGRTNRAALEKVFSIALAEKGDCAWKRIAVVHAGIPDQAAQWVETAKRALGYNGPVEVIDFGPVVTVHVGPGMLGVTGYWA